MEISINTAGATKRELLLVAGLFTGLADVTEYVRTTTNTPLPPVDFRPEPDEPVAIKPFSASQLVAALDKSAASTKVGELHVDVSFHDEADAAGFGYDEPEAAEDTPPVDLANKFAATVTPPAHVPAQTAPAVPLPPFVPPAPPVGTVPLPPTVASVGTDAPVERDTDGLPWDARIHAGTRGRNTDGRWKARKGLNDPAMVARVKAELLGVAGSVPVPPSLPPAVNGAAVPHDFPSLCVAMTPLKATQEQINEALRCVGAESLPMLGISQPAKIPAFWAALLEEVA